MRDCAIEGVIRQLGFKDLNAFRKVKKKIFL